MCMYVCMYVYIHVCMVVHVYMCICMHVNTQHWAHMCIRLAWFNLHIYLYVYTPVFTFVCMYVCMLPQQKNPHKLPCNRQAMASARKGVFDKSHLAPNEDGSMGVVYQITSLIP